MQTVPRVVAIHDLSGLGRCSLTAAIPILAAMGVQACPLPTAVLSAQTGFDGYRMTPLTEQIRQTLDHWRAMNARFDGIFTGFLADEGQVAAVIETAKALRTPEATLFVDPVLGDDGALYPVFTARMVDAVQALVATADTITPNLTEACFLTGTPLPTGRAIEDDFVWSLAGALTAMGPQTVVITGVHQGESVCDFAWLGAEGRGLRFAGKCFAGSFSGTGDILASVLCAALVRGRSIVYALERARALFDASLPRTRASGGDPRDGIVFEPYLYLLHPEEDGHEKP